MFPNPCQPAAHAPTPEFMSMSMLNGRGPPSARHGLELETASVSASVCLLRRLCLCLCLCLCLRLCVSAYAYAPAPASRLPTPAVRVCICICICNCAALELPLSCPGWGSLCPRVPVPPRRCISVPGLVVGYSTD